MARRKTGADLLLTRNQLAERLRCCRIERFGHRGGALMARQLGVPVRTWYNYEAGVTVPAEVLLRCLELMNLEPRWLLNGQEPKYRVLRTDSSSLPPAASVAGSVRDLLRMALNCLETGAWPEPGPPLDGPLAATLAPLQGRSGHDGWPGHGNGLATSPSSHGQSLPAQGGLDGILAVGAPGYDGLACVRVDESTMEPIIAPGALAAYAGVEEPYEDLAGSLVVAWVGGIPLVRWFGVNGRFGCLRAENLALEPGTRLIDLCGPPAERRVRRVLWLSTPHVGKALRGVPPELDPATSSGTAPGRG